MPRTRRDWLIITIVVAALGIFWLNATRAAAADVNPTGRPPAPEIGHPAPDFTLPASDGSLISLAEFKGQPVILNFWATWCGPCRAEIPALQAVWESPDSQGVIFGIDVQEPAERVVAFMADYGMTYPVALDQSAEVARLYRVRAFPTTYFINSRGVIIDIYTGPLNEPLLLKWLAELNLDHD